MSDEHPVDSKDGSELVESTTSEEYEEYLRLSAQFDEKRLRSLLWKIDVRLLPPLGLVYLLS
jgi:hypothetical protein